MKSDAHSSRHARRFLRAAAAFAILTTGAFAQPANDACEDAAPISRNASVQGTTLGAADNGDSLCGGNSTPDVYYVFTPAESGVVRVFTCLDTSYDTVISVHNSCPANQLNQIVCNNDSCGTRSELTLPVVAGRSYIIRVAGATGAGTFTLSVGDPPPAPSGPDVTLQDALSVQNFGAVDGIRAYAIGSSTCNIGDENLLWTNFGTPALAMNAYRLHNGRLVQIGLGFCKTACCAAAGPGCGRECNGQGGNVLGVGCRDVYGAGYNGGQSHLAPRSVINAYTGSIGSFSHTSGDAVFRRLQVAQSEMSTAAYPGALFFVEGHYVATDDAQTGNDLNNASYRRVVVNQSSYDMTVQDGQVMKPAIHAWRDHGLGANVPDPSVNLVSVDVPTEGRYWVATKVTPLENGRYLYDYAIYNFNSDLSGGSLTIPKTPAVEISGVGFHDVDYHSGEPYDNTDWVSTVGSDFIRWSSPETFKQNPNSNALRWGTMYNFWFEASTPPVTGTVTLGFFKPHDPDSVSFDAPIPSGACAADWNADGSVNSQDFFDFVEDFFNLAADFNGDGVINSQDFFDFLGVFFEGC